MEETTIDRPEAAKERPLLLKALCVLTWIGSGLILIGCLLLMVLLKANPDGPVRNNWIDGVLLLVLMSMWLCVAGSIGMWLLRKWGFYLYAAGQIGPVALLVYAAVAGHTRFDSINPGMFVTLFGTIIPVAFTLLYARALNYLR